MTTYTVYLPPITTGSTRDQLVETVLIPKAPSLLALAFPLPWLLWYRLWWASLFYMLLSLVALILLPTDLTVIVIVLTIFPGFFLLLEGQELRRKMLERRGWKMVAVIEERDRASAEYRYFHSVQDNQENMQENRDLVQLEPSGQKFPRKADPVDTGIEFPGSVELS